MKTFEAELYEAMCAAFPKTTVRSISRAMGMSDGYWSSVAAQGLNVSNLALKNLSEHLEVRLVQLVTGAPKALQVKSVQALIAKEIVARFAQDIEPVDQVWSEVIAVAAREHEALSGGFGAMPFVMCRS